MANPFSKAWRRAEAIFQLQVSENPSRAQAIKGHRRQAKVGDREVAGLPEREHFAEPRRSDALPNAENRLAGIDCETGLGSVDS
jgi:hypothetical protein